MPFYSHQSHVVAQPSRSHSHNESLSESLRSLSWFSLSFAVIVLQVIRATLRPVEMPSGEFCIAGSPN